MNFFSENRQKKTLAYPDAPKNRRRGWRKLISAVLCIALLSTTMVDVLAVDTSAETSVTENPLVAEENGQSTGSVFSDADALEETPAPSSTPEQTEPEEESKAEADPETEAVYTLYLTHIFRFTIGGKGRNVSASETLELTEADFEDGVCDLSRFVYDAEQLTVTEANPLSIEDFDENRQGGARIVYAVSSGWKVVRKEDATGEGSVLREVFSGKLSDYEFVPANVVRINVEHKYSNTGGLAGVDAASPAVIEAIPEKQSDGTYKVTWDLPTVEGFRIVLDPSELNQYVVSPPTGNETAAELEAKLENGYFDVDIANHTIYYYQEQSGQDTNPTYQNRYSTEYNQAWNNARTLTAANYTATAVGDNDNRGANPLENPKLEVTLTETQLNQALNGADLDITVYYRRNATWYTVNHWVPETLAGGNTTGLETKEVDGTTYVRLEQETLQGRVGALTRAKAKTTAAYEQLQSVGFSQKLIENTDTVVDIYYKAADSYRVIFDTDYTYIPRQQVALGSNVDFTNITKPKRTGYTFDGWRYLNKNAAPNADGSYNDDQYTELDKVTPALTVNEDLIAAAKLTESGGVLALHLYPKWEPATTNVRVILWTEDLTGEDDVQATAAGGNTTYYNGKYADYSAEPVTHGPQLGKSDPHYSNAGSFTVSVPTDSSLLENNNATLLSSIQGQVENEFKTTMGQVSGIDVANFYKQAAFEIVHEEESGINYNATTASADGKTTIYVYFTRNVYTLQFHYYGAADGNDPAVATNTNGYSWGGINQPGSVFAANGDLNFNYSGVGNDSTTNNTWSGIDGGNMLVPKTITIKAKYGADLRDVWPVARAVEQAGNLKMISWATTRGKYCEDGLYGAAGSTHLGEPTIMGVYAAMGSEIIAKPNDPNTPHHLVAYWNDNGPSYYRYNHCYEVPDLNVNDNSIQKVSIYNNDTANGRNFLYLVPTDNAAIAQYGFNDLMRVSLNGNQIAYGDPDGTFYAVRAYNGSYYAVARQVETVSTNAIEKQNPSARLHMTRANTNADHSTQYYDNQGNSNPYVGTAADPYDLYFYYNRDRYTITYMAPSNNITTATEVTLGRVELPYGALVTQEKYGYELNYTSKNTDSAYGWTAATPEVSVCPDRAENGTAAWTFKGWGLGPAGVNMQWTVDENAEAEAQAGEKFAIESNLRLYAIWDAPVYTVTFRLNGGTVNGSSSDIKEEIPANTRYSANGVIPRPLRDNYTLDGWYVLDENGDITDTEFDFDQAITENKRVAAKWSAVSTTTFEYTVYYVTNNPLDADKDKDTVQINNGNIVPDGGTAYYVLGKVEHKDQMFIANSSLNFSATLQSGYVPQQVNQILTMGEATDTYNVIFYYDPITPGQHVVQFVEAGTETSTNPILVKTLTVKADQTVVTPKSDVATELKNMGYALVNKNGDQYTEVEKADKLTWIDENGNSRSTATLKGTDIPDTITYLVQPIPYTVTYKNAADSPAAADGALAAVTAAVNTPVADANGKNPTQYTTKDTFTAKNPARVYENGKWYVFSHWSLGTDTTEKNNRTTFSTLKVDPGTVGNLIFVANWTEMTDTGSLTVSKTVSGSAGEQTKDFNFTVTLGDTSINGTIGDMTFANGVATFTLKHNESKTANLPTGITYGVVETEANQDGYTTASTGASGTITANGAATASFTNTKEASTPTPVPSSTPTPTPTPTSTPTLAPTPTPGTGEPTPAPGTGEPTPTPGPTDPTSTPDPVNPAPTSDPGTPGDPNKPSDSASNMPQTGDESNLSLWLVLMGASSTGAVSALAVSRKRRKRARHSK